MTDVVEQIAHILYDCEKVRAESARSILADGKPIGCEGILMEPYEECAEAFRSDARAVVEAMSAKGTPVGSRKDGIRDCIKLVVLLTEGWRRDATETSDPGGRRWEMTQTGERIERHLQRLLTAPVPPQVDAVAVVERLRKLWSNGTGNLDDTKADAADEIICALKEAGHG